MPCVLHVLWCLLALVTTSATAPNATGPWPRRGRNPSWRMGEYYVQQTVVPPIPFRPWTDYSVRHPSGCDPALVVCTVTHVGNARHDMIAMHWVHAAEVLLNCWPLFHRFPNLKPVVLLTERIRLNKAPWVHALQQLMTVDVTGRPPRGCAVMGNMVKHRRDGWPGVETKWLTRRKEAAELRERLLRLPQARELRAALHARAGDHGRGALSGQGLSIGVLTRTVRGLADGPNIVAALQRELPGARLNTTTFDAMPPVAQGAWVAAHDLIISPHGAQNLNFLFLRPCAVVLEVFPAKYYIPGYYLQLARAAGARAFEAYPGPNAIRDGRIAGSPGGARLRAAARLQDIPIQAADVLGILPAMLEGRRQCRLGLPESELTSVQLEAEARARETRPMDGSLSAGSVASSGLS